MTSLRQLLTNTVNIRARIEKNASPIILLASAITLYPDAANAADNGGVVLILLIVGILILIIYFLPTIIAFNKSHPNRWVILALNAFLGTTGLIWIICLIWAMKAVHISEELAGSDGGESGLNIFANDEKRVRTVNQMNVARPVAAGEKPDVATEISRLKGLLDSGAITQSEFDELKRKVISS